MRTISPVLLSHPKRWPQSEPDSTKLFPHQAASCQSKYIVKERDSVTRFFPSGFFKKSSSTKPLIIAFQIFSKFVEILTSQGEKLVSATTVANLPPVSTTPAVNFATGSAVALSL
jgi:hypothetical protein